MSLWPFGRKGDRKRPRSGALSDLEVPGIVEPIAPSVPGRPHGSTAASPNAAEAAPRPAPKKRRTNGNSPTKQIHRRPRAQSFSSARRDSIQMAQDSTGEHGASERRGQRTTFITPSPQHNANSSAAAPNCDDDLQRVPTLHSRRDSTQHKRKSRRRNSRRTRGDDDDQSKGKAAADAPLRPATDALASGRVIKKDSKVVKSGFGFGRNSQCSIISLPTPESIHSSLSSDSEHGFKVSTFDSLAPRPTIHCSGPSYQPAMRASTQRKHLSAPISAQTLKAHKRVNSLADNLDASELRVLMERDNRRREKRQQRDRERMETRLSQRAAVQREEEERARQMGLSPPRNYDRGVFGRELDGLRAPSTIWAPRRDSDASMEESHIPRFSFQSERPADLDQPAEPQQAEHQPQPTQLQEPAEIVPIASTEPEPVAMIPVARSIEAPVPPPTIQVRPGSEPQEEEATQEQIPTPPTSPAVVDTLKRKQSASRSSLASEQGKFTVVKLPRLDDEAVSSNPSISGKPERQQSKKKAISTFFRWPSRRAPATPQSFSNTSREEMMAVALQAQAQSRALATSQSRETITPTHRVGSNVPKRTRSRFKEDLPEHPMSPPPSRLQSPDADAGTNDGASSLRPFETQSYEYLSVQPTPRYGTPTSGHRSMDETVRNTPISWQNRATSTEPPASTSFASVDSEASWFSGGAGTRRKSSMSRTVSRATYRPSLNLSYESLSHGTEDHIMDDDYMTQLSPISRPETITNRQSVEEGRPSSDEEDMSREDFGNPRWGAVEASQARVVAGRQGRVIKSCQGLVDMAPAEAEVADNASASSSTRRSIISAGSAVLSRARSIILRKGQPRPISIGSAKLLDLSQPPVPQAPVAQPPAEKAEKRQSSERRRSMGRWSIGRRSTDSQA